MNERGIVALQVVHRGAHAGVAFAEPQVIGRIVFGGLALRPVPAAGILQIDDVDRRAADDGPRPLAAADYSRNSDSFRTPAAP